MDINFTLSDESLRNLRNAVIGSMGPTLPGIDGNAIDYTALGDEISYSELAEQFDAQSIAENVCTRDVAVELDMEDLASHLDAREIARHVDTTDIARDVAGELDLSDVARELVDDLDYTSLAYEIDKDQIAEARDHSVIAKFIVERFQSNAEFRACVVESFTEHLLNRLRPMHKTVSV